MQEQLTHVLVSDVDETLVNSVQRHVERLSKEGLQRGWKHIPTYDEVILAGGTHAAYAHIPEYRALNEQMRFDEEFNTDLAPIPDAVEAIPFLELALAAYLTTRPTSLEQLTRRELRKLGFPDRPVICRPESVDLCRTEEWKLSVLAQLAVQIGKKLVMVDDNVRMHKAIVAANNPQILSALFAGPMTPIGRETRSWREIPLMIPGLHSNSLLTSEKVIG